MRVRESGGRCAIGLFAGVVCAALAAGACDDAPTVVLGKLSAPSLDAGQQAPARTPHDEEREHSEQAEVHAASMQQVPPTDAGLATDMIVAEAGTSQAEDAGHGSQAGAAAPRDGADAGDAGDAGARRDAAASAPAPDAAPLPAGEHDDEHRDERDHV